MANSQRIGMPLLSVGQAQKEITHNEALNLLDTIVCACCSGSPSDTPPQVPEVGLSYICGPTPTGAWQGKQNRLACFTPGGWRFIEPFDGLQVVDRMTGCNWRYMGGQWSSGIVDADEVRVHGLKVLSGRQPAIGPASGGTTIDTEARSVLAEVLGALRSHGLIEPAE